MSRWKVVSGLVAGVVLAAGIAAGASGLRGSRVGATDSGDLTPLGCIGTVGLGPVGCGAGANLKDATAIAISPDGKSVYSEGLNGALEIFSRDADGTLTGTGCFGNSAPPDRLGPAKCTPAPGISAVNSIALPADGKILYAAANSTNSIAIFTRDASGSLASSGCVMQAKSNVAAGCTQTANHLEGTQGIAVSPDGASVYVVSQPTDTLQTFSRAASGGLTPGACFIQTGAPGAAGSDCTLVDGLDGPLVTVITPDGKNVYVGAHTAVALFKRSAGGSLSYTGCVGYPQGGPASCTAKAGIKLVEDIAVSPDGSNVYAAAGNGVLQTFTRAADGSLTPAGCIKVVGSTENCTTSAVGLIPEGVAVSPDGKSVYAASPGYSDVTALARDATGNLTFSSCVANSDSNLSACTKTAGLGYAQRVVVSPDGKNVYVTAAHPGSLVMFARATVAAAPATTTAATTTATKPAAIPLARLVSAQVSRGKNGARMLVVRVRLAAQASVTVKLAPRRGAAFLTRVTTFGTGAHTVTATLPSTAKAGSYSLTISVKGPKPRHATLAATVSVPR